VTSKSPLTGTTDTCREQNAVKTKIVDSAGCAHKREPLVKGP
jgi:hypothetical protein